MVKKASLVPESPAGDVTHCCEYWGVSYSGESRLWSWLGGSEHRKTHMYSFTWIEPRLKSASFNVGKITLLTSNATSSGNPCLSSTFLQGILTIQILSKHLQNKITVVSRSPPVFDLVLTLLGSVCTHPTLGHVRQPGAGTSGVACIGRNVRMGGHMAPCFVFLALRPKESGPLETEGSCLSISRFRPPKTPFCDSISRI